MTVCALQRVGVPAISILFYGSQANAQLSGDQQLELRYASAGRPSGLNGIQKDRFYIEIEYLDICLSLDIYVPQYRVKLDEFSLGDSDTKHEEW